MFTQIHQGQYVPGFVVISRFIGDPYFNFVDGNRRTDDRQLGQCLIVMIAKILGKKEVPVGIILRSFHFESCFLCPAFHFHHLGFALVLREDSGQVQFPKLHFSFYPKQVGCPRDQRTIQRQRNIPGLNSFDDVVFIARIIQVHFILVIECGFGVVVHLHFHFLANTPVYIHLNFLIEIKRRGFSQTLRDRGIFSGVHLIAKTYLHISLRAHIDGIATKDAVESFAAYRKFGDKRTLGFEVGLICALPPVISDRILKIVTDIFLQRHVFG